MRHAVIDFRLMVFAKAPEPGSVKTRLVPVLGEAGAAQLHRQLVEHALGIARACCLGEVELWCSPDAGDPFFRDCAARHGAQLREQGSGDLGGRMGRALEAALAQGKRGLLIGSDCPAMSADYLRQAAGALDAGNDAVFGPAEDGGYVLVGLARTPAAQLFEGMAWGEASVMQRTRERLRRFAWRWHELPVLWDVDRPADLLRMQRAADAGK
jgi:rSAM/selenodomain-associated transferase 1